jgi:thiamine kinase-like enzyme
MIDCIAQQFSIDGQFISASPFGTGHINDTTIAGFDQSGVTVRYILRKINSNVFPRPEILVRNTVAVLAHVKQRLIRDSVADWQRRVMEMIYTNEKSPHVIDEKGDYWCCFRFIENAMSLEVVDKPEQACEAAAAYGLFQRYLSELDVRDFEPVIDDFHNIVSRFEAFEKAVRYDSQKRAGKASKEIDTIKSAKHIVDAYDSLMKTGEIPLRVTHNDTKLNNVLLDAEAGQGLCVTDLDTVMPGTVLYDFGDMVRSFTSPADEDETDLSRVSLRKDVFEALSRGYLKHLNDVLTHAEKTHLIFGAKMMTLIMAIRFLTDYLNGDVYYRISRAGHNLDRCRNQLELFRHIDRNADELQRIVDAAGKTNDG